MANQTCRKRIRSFLNAIKHENEPSKAHQHFQRLSVYMVALLDTEALTIKGMGRIMNVSTSLLFKKIKLD